MHFSARISLVSLIIAGAVVAAENGGALPKSSPFVLRGGPAAPAAVANETIEFAGVSSIVGKKTDLIFYDKTSKKSHWIAKGETKEGIAVINYDERREEAVVKVNGVQKTLALRKGGKSVGGPRPVATLPSGFNVPLPASVPDPATGPTGTSGNSGVPQPLPAPAANTASAQPAAPAPAPGTPAEIQTRQETEARMLVSDLLEIGMAQRRAYEDAQRKAAEGSAPTQNPPAFGTPQVVPAQPAQPGN